MSAQKIHVTWKCPDTKAYKGDVSPSEVPKVGQIVRYDNWLRVGGFDTEVVSVEGSGGTRVVTLRKIDPDSGQGLALAREAEAASRGVMRSMVRQRWD